MLDGEFIEPGFVAENGVEVDVEMFEHVEQVFDWVVDQEFDRIWNEVRVPVGAALGINDPDLFWGTSDIVALKGTAIYIVDAKFGIVPVEVRKENPDTGEDELNDQAMCYLVGALRAIGDKIPGEFDEIHLAIIQPRAGGVKHTTVSWQEVAEWKKQAVEAVRLALSDDAPFNPSESACRFCPGSGSCRAQVLDEFHEIEDVDDVDQLTDAELAAWLDKADHIVATVKAMKGAAMRRLEAGRNIPGWVREQGKGKARWRDPDEVVAEIEAAGLDLDEYAPRTPTTQGKLKTKNALGAKLVETLVVRPPADPKLVRASEAKNPLGSEFEPIDD